MPRRLVDVKSVLKLTVYSGHQNWPRQRLRALLEPYASTTLSQWRWFWGHEIVHASQSQTNNKFMVEYNLWVEKSLKLSEMVRKTTAIWG